MADSESLKNDVQKTKEDAANSFGQLKDDAVRVAQSAAELGRSGLEQAKAKFADSKDQLTSKLSDGKEQLNAKIADGKDVVRARISDGSDAVREAAYKARARGNDVLSSVQQQIEEKPLQAVAIAAGVGVVLGILLRR